MRKTTKALSLFFVVLMLMFSMSTIAFAAPKKPAATKKISYSATTTSIKLTWNKVSGATGYRVYQSVSGKWKVVGKGIKKTTYTVKKLKPGTSYKLAVRTYKTSGGKTSWSGYKSISAKTKAVANPASLKATPVAGGKVTLSWKKVSGATGYVVQIYRNKAWEKLKTTTGTTYTASALNPTVSTKFRVKAYIKVSNKNYYSSGVTISAKAGAVSVGKVDKVTATAASNSVTLSWAGSGNIAGYRIYQYDPVDGTYDVIVQSTTAKTYTVKNLKPSTLYTFRVRPFARSGSYTAWGKEYQVKKATNLAAPNSIGASIMDNDVTLIWSSVDYADGYKVYEYNGKYVEVGDTTSASFTLSYTKGEMKKLAVRAYINNDQGSDFSDYKEITVGGVYKYRNIFKSGEYSFKSDIDGQATNIYVKNGSCQMSTVMPLSDGVNAECRIIYNKDKKETIALIDIDGMGGFYTTKVSEMVGEDLDMTELTAYGQRFYSDEIATDIMVKEEYLDGQRVITESYVNSKGETVEYYFKNGELIRHDVITQYGNFDFLYISDVKASVDDSKVSTKIDFMKYINIDLFV